MSQAPAAATTVLSRLLETPEPLSLTDEVSVAAARIRATGLPALPVVADGKLLGVVPERAVLHGLLQSSAAHPLTCGDLVRTATVVSAAAPLNDAAALLELPDVDLLVVGELEGRYDGVISRARLFEHLAEVAGPRLVGGMATPFGVHLTTVDHRGGAGDWALVLTGMYLAVLAVISRYLAAALLAAVAADPQQAALAQLAPPLVKLGALPPPGLPAELLEALLFLLLIRLSSLAGYHSGEHQTVHALERGLPLTREHVGAMPRVHPRCGTNLVVLVGLLGLGARLLHDAATQGRSLGWVMPLLLPLLFWQPLGNLVQRVFTTRPASRKQLEAGIRAARALLSQHQRRPEHRAGMIAAVWNRGLVQVVLGFVLMSTASEHLAALLGRVMALRL